MQRVGPGESFCIGTDDERWSSWTHGTIDGTGNGTVDWAVDGTVHATVDGTVDTAVDGRGGATVCDILGIAWEAY